MLAEQKPIYTASEIEAIRAKERQAELRLVARTGQERTLKTLLLSCMFLFFSLCFSYVALSTSIYNKGYEINNAKNEITAMKSKAERVGLEVDYLSSMERIEPLAFAMGMMYPKSEDSIFVAYTPVDDSTAAPVAAIASDMPQQIEIEVLDSEPMLSVGSRIIQVVGSLFGGHFEVNGQLN